MLLHALLTFRHFVGLNDAISEINHNTYMIIENTTTNTVVPNKSGFGINGTWPFMSKTSSSPAFPSSQS